MTTSVVYDAQEATQVATTNTERNSVERYTTDSSVDSIMSGIAPAITHKEDEHKKIETNTVIMAYLDKL